MHSNTMIIPTGVTCNNCSVAIDGPYDETRQPATFAMPVIQFSPVMIGSTIWINCSISHSFEPSLRVVFTEGSGFNEIKLPTEGTEEQTAFMHSVYETTSTGCGNIAGDKQCYSFPITIISDNMDRAMVMCGARKTYCPTTFLPTVGIIRVDINNHVMTSATDAPCQTTAMSSTVTVVSNEILGNLTTTSHFKCTDTFLAVIGLSTFIAGVIFGFLVCLPLTLLTWRWCRLKSRKNEDHRNEGNGAFYDDLYRYHRR